MDWQRLDDYLARWGADSLIKRLGYLVEMLGLPLPDREERLARWQHSLSSGIALLEPRNGRAGHIVTRWRLRDNVGKIWQLQSSGQ